LPLNDNAIGWLQLALSATGAGLLLWSWILERQGRPQAWRRARDVLLVALGILGAAAYFNFGRLHHPNFIHVWDTYHYYIGAKYFPELGYERIYECTVAAEAEHESRFTLERRSIRDLRTNEIVPARKALEAADACRQRFTDERWNEFRRDIGFFRTRVPQLQWERILKDHGYNATPVWNALGHVLANTGPATKSSVVLLLLLDPFFLLATAAMVAWAFGWRVAMVVLLFLGTEIPGRFLWTGGAFLRHDWLSGSWAACAC
jgi:hypothetical protein